MKTCSALAQLFRGQGEHSRRAVGPALWTGASACLVAVCIVLGVGNEAFARVLASLKVTPDGSVDPPGDRIEMEMFGPPSAANLLVEVRAFFLSGPDNSWVQQVRARGDENKDAQGMFLLKAGVRQQEPAAGAERAPAHSIRSGRFAADIVVPYAQLDLPSGQHQLAYEVRLMHGRFVVEVQPTMPYPVTITGKPRTRMFVKIERFVNALQHVESEGVVVRNGKPQREKFSREEIVRKPVLEAIEKPVDIPRGWERPVPAPSVVDPEDPQGYFHALAEKPWFPLRKAVVYFETNRHVEQAGESSAKRFGNEVGEAVQHGSCLVNLPVEHRRGVMEVPSKWNPWERRDPRKHFGIDALNALSADSFAAALRGQLAGKEHDVLLFVHGFGTSFENAVLKLAQLVYDIDFRGMPLAFSWPSEGVVSKAAYDRDERKAAQSVSALAQSLSSMIQERRRAGSQAGKIHLIAHSMGNRVLLEALRTVKPGLAEGERPFGQVVFAAPDVDVNTFVTHFVPLAGVAEGMSLYFCARDKALRISKGIHGESVVGLRWLFLDPLENIDATNADTSFLGHSYYSTSREMLIDLQMLITGGLRPPQRATLRSARALGHEYWLFP